LTPAQVRHAYGFDQIAFQVNGRSIAGDGSGQTIAIIDAYDDPNIASDLHYFDRTFGLPDPPTFTKATPQGVPRSDPLWALEIALDVEWAHAIAPGANILLVESISSNGSDLLAAVDYARQQPGVVSISMSWGSPEFAGEASFDSHFTTPAGHFGGSTGMRGDPMLPGGITLVASTGDNGAKHGAQWPAISPNVLAVGGTTLRVLDSWGSYSGETGWSGSGGGISAYYGEPAYQLSVQNWGKRSIPDVSYDGDPNSGFYVYTSVAYHGSAGWFSVAGTSAAAPQWAALIAIADQGRALAGKGSLDGVAQTLPAIYQFSNRAFHDITSGNNGFAAGIGYDLVTGRGSPYANIIVQGFLTLPYLRPAGFSNGSSGNSTSGKRSFLPGLTFAGRTDESSTTTQDIRGFSTESFSMVVGPPVSTTGSGVSRFTSLPLLSFDPYGRGVEALVSPRWTLPVTARLVTPLQPADRSAPPDHMEVRPRIAEEDGPLPLEEGTADDAQSPSERIPEAIEGKGDRLQDLQERVAAISRSEFGRHQAIDQLFAAYSRGSPPAVNPVEQSGVEGSASVDCWQSAALVIAGALLSIPLDVAAVRRSIRSS
jgi:subtilase family serine protease